LIRPPRSVGWPYLHKFARERAHGVGEVCAQGADRFSIRARGHEQLVVDFDEARQTAHALARTLD